MIKVCACIFMFIDHFGLLFYSDIIIFRLIGRISMPLFAYCIARGFYFTTDRIAYIKRIAIFAAISQVPYMLMEREIKGNIGVLWLFCLLIFNYTEKKDKAVSDYAIMITGIAAIMLIPMDYGIYGLFFVLILYYFLIKCENSFYLYLGYVIIHMLLFLRGTEYGFIQLFTLPSLPIIDILQRYDKKVKIDRRFYYFFYPVHMLILVIVQHVLA